MAERLEIFIDGKSVKAQKAIKDTTTQLKKNEAQIKGMKAGLTSFRAGWLKVAAGIAAVVAIGVKAVKAFAEQEKAELLLNKAFSKTADNADELTETFKAFAAEQQRVTKFGDEVTIMAAAQLQALAGLTGEGLEKAIKATMDLSVAQGIDLNTAALLVGKSVSSSTNALSRYGIEMESGGDVTSRLNDLTTTLSEKFGGFAEKEGASAAGVFARLSNDIGDVFEVIGSFLTPALVTLSNLFGKLVTPAFDLESATKDLVKINREYEQVLIDLEDPTNTLTAAQQGLLTVQKSQLQVKFVERLKEINDIFIKSNKTGGFFKGTQEKLIETSDRLSRANTILRTTLDDIDDGFITAVQAARNLGLANISLKAVQNEAAKVADALVVAETKLTEELIKNQAGVNELTGAFLDGILTTERFRLLNEELQQAIQNNIPRFKAEAEALKERNESAAASAKARKNSEIAAAKALEVEEKRITDEKLARELVLADEVKLIQDTFNEATKLSETELIEFKIEKLDELKTRFIEDDEVMNQIRIASADLNRKLQEQRAEDFVSSSKVINKSIQDVGNIFSTVASRQVDIEQKKLDAIEDKDSAAFKAQEKRVKDAARKQAIINKGLAISQASLGVAQAVAGAFAATPGGVIIKSAAGLLALGIATANLALVAAKPIPSFIHGADFVVPEGFPRDTFPMAVTSGERVTVTPAGEEGGRSMINIETVIIQAEDPEDFAEKLEEFAISTGGRIRSR